MRLRRCWLRPARSRSSSRRTVGAGAHPAGRPSLSVHTVKIFIIRIVIVLMRIRTGRPEDRLHKMRGKLGRQDYGGGLD